ncbi:MAG: GUN4 domain-containing protein, partial [Moorea sp. SIO2B7]|nr:GUN4 domain-containing protein [Moorena sp. SIO2B7]
MMLSASESQQLLQKIALEMVAKNSTQTTYNALLEFCQKLLPKIDQSVNAAEFLKKIEQVSELLVKVDNYYEFAHLSFQGYLAAVEINEQKRENLLLQHWQKAWWKETIVLYCAQFNPSNFLRELIKIGSKEAVALAYECLKESPRNIDTEIKSNVEKLLYQQLDEFLKNGQWKEADQETDRLMLQIAGKEEEEYLYVEDIQNFSAENLRAMDKLWVKYSNGKFGFSVQKQIWLDCGGKIGEYDYEAYEKLGDRVGWYVNGSWISYSKYTFNTNALPGHLPRSPLGGCVRG